MSREDRDKWQYPGSKPSEGTQITVSYNGDWLSIVSGVLFHLSEKSLWESAPDDILEEISELQYLLETPVTIPSFQNTMLWLPPQAKIVAGTGLDFIVNTGSAFNGLWHRSTPAINDEMNFKVALKAGSYTLEYGYAKSSGSGQTTYSTSPNVLSGTIEQYNATTQLNQVQALNFTMAADGDLTITLKVAGKNASSSGYVQNWTHLALRLQ
jgi:hypothetical protein